MDSLTARLRAEFLEMPGLRLTIEQVQRLCGIDRAVCQLVLDALIDAGFLRTTADGCYARAADGRWPRPHAAKVGQSGAHSKKAS